MRPKPDSTPLGQVSYLGHPPKRSPAALLLNLDFDEWPDKLFLIYVRDRLIWIYGEPEEAALIQRLNDIIHRQEPPRCSL